MPAPKSKKNSPVKKTVKKSVKHYNWTHTHIIYFCLGACGLATTVIVCALGWFVSLGIPSISSFNDYKPQVATLLLDRDGRYLDAICREFRIVVPFHQLQPALMQAFVAAEDSNYWDHAGLDGWSIFRAMINNLRSGSKSQGGSTITQQVTRALMLSREKSYFRKFTEAVLAYRLEKLLSKEEILAIYLNEIYFGEGAYGVEAAARIYFSKKASELTLSEAALLAGLPQSPSRYSPILHFDRAKERQRYVLNRMAEEGFISADRARNAYQAEVVLNRLRQQKDANGYFSQYVRSELEKEYQSNELYREGLVVTTTLDPALQEAAIEALKQGAEAVGKRRKGKESPQGALVAIQSANGRIVAMVGGTDFSDSPFNRAVQGRRQPGSVFKPVVYAAALERGIPLDKVLYDAPMTLKNPDGSVWAPKNYNGEYAGATTLRNGLIHSRNIVSIKLLQQVGFSPVLKLAENMGIHSPLRRELPLALGGSNVTLLEMTEGYTVFANNGLHVQSSGIIKIRSGNGKVRTWNSGKPRQVISAKTATAITSVLREAIERGTGRKAFGIPGGAGKTGTTDENRDAWFIGYDHRITTGVWIGHDRSRSLGKGETGGQAAAPVWKAFMASVPR